MQVHFRLDLIMEANNIKPGAVREQSDLGPNSLQYRLPKNISRWESRQQSQYGPRREKTCLREFGNNTGTDQPAHPRSLISAFVVRFLESIIIYTCYERSFDFLASRCSLAGWFESHFFGNPEDRFCRFEAHIVKATPLYINY